MVINYKVPATDLRRGFRIRVVSGNSSRIEIVQSVEPGACGIKVHTNHGLIKCVPTFLFDVESDN